jgi:hypothetical protein
LYLTIDLILLNMTLTNDRPVLSSERAPHFDRTVTFKQEEMSGHETQTGLDNKTDRLTVSCNGTSILTLRKTAHT